MSSFRKFLQKESVLNEIGVGNIHRPGISRIAGIYDLPDPQAATQMQQGTQVGDRIRPVTKIGGYDRPSTYIQWQVEAQRWNQPYPLAEIHKLRPDNLTLNMTKLTYEQAKRAFVDLAARVSSIGSVIASGGNVPGDRDMTARMKKALFKNQVYGEQPNARCDIYEIYNVDGRVFFGEVSGRGGTLGFKLGEALEVVIPTTTPDPEDPAGGIAGNHYDIDVRKLKHHLEIAIQEFSRWERELESKLQWGKLFDAILDKSAAGAYFQSTKSINPLATAAMAKR
jgi:hypothetical protein